MREEFTRSRIPTFERLTPRQVTGVFLFDRDFPLVEAFLDSGLAVPPPVARSRELPGHGRGVQSAGTAVETVPGDP
jgi:hypothetical protein